MQASLIPTVLSLSDFFRRNFPHIDWYPYWYLGNPFRYLIGPVVPFLLAIAHSIVPFASLYSLYILLIIISLICGGLGIYVFLAQEKRSQLVGIVSGILYVVLPINWAMLHFQDGLKIVAFAVVPYVFIIYDSWVHVLIKRKLSWIRTFLLIFLISFCLLISIELLLVLVIGASVLLMGEVRSKKHIVWGEIVIRTVFVFSSSLCLVTFWYTPSFWWVLLSDPSFGGVPLWHLFLNILGLSFQFLPLVLAVLVVKWRAWKVKGIDAFGFYFLVSFVVLTVIRFVSNPAFVIDWIGFGTELQFATALMGGIVFSQIYRKLRTRHVYLLGAIFFLCIGISVYLSKDVIFYSTSDYYSSIVRLVSLPNIDFSRRFFLSGSPVFWINQYLPIQQVRGGNDTVSLHPTWAEGAYQIREGESSALAEDWLDIFASQYVLINKDNSQEMFHDFKHIEKFQDFEKIGDLSGNSVYNVNRGTMARIAKSDILSVGKLVNGADSHTLSEYVSAFVRPAGLVFVRANKFRVSGDMHTGEVLSLAITFAPGWHLLQGQGTVAADSLGNIVVIPSHGGNQTFILEYTSGWDWYPLVGVVVVLLWFGVFSSRVAGFILHLSDKVHIGIGEEDDY
jgi:hypothetical protein